ncbi:hypothetical protein, variant 1 [Cladophialophora immunda]|uniref:Ribosome biogenesis protein Alb1 n=1 Tax=Cladophialophora immunda TaxID=569365 RepID=A0A0D2B7J2_9EURO|nr:uncharacterized protein PV07_00365 [Cladophialophora immunda]XP_016253739.1 hypothetical protein, variant 1 [Cladophialophora immunda]KIW33522.1 hypothetical protein PV07_00365 [Cladophialophora immunda]KIW33523.1 hypothetical protein, variant 1 [Cladophialophora immunda]
MAKTSKIKRNPIANPRSRASKRATSPSIDVDKSIRDAPRASDATPILAARPNSGVTKAKRKQKPLSRGQRRRHEKGLARAEKVQDQFERKIEDASHRLKKRRERKGMWDEVNGTNKFDRLKAALGDEADQNEDEWEDMEEVSNDGGRVKDIGNLTTISKTKLVVVDRTAPAPAAPLPPATTTLTQEEEDEADKIT